MKKRLVPVLLALLLAACGGGGGGGTPAPSAAGASEAPAPAPVVASDATPPTLSAFLPSAPTGVSRTADIGATFSEALLAESVTPANLHVTRGSAQVAGKLAYDAASRRVAFVPERPLDLLASYTVTAETGLKDVAGNGLASKESWTFRTGDGSWEGVQRLDLEDARSFSADTALDGAGNVAAVWVTSSGGSFRIRAAVNVPGSGWSAAVTVSTSGSRFAFSPRLGFDSQANVLAVWKEMNEDLSGYGSVWSARFLKGEGWQPAVRVDPLVGINETMSLAVDAAGNAWAVWTKPFDATASSLSDVWGARFTPAGGWQEPTRIGGDASIADGGSAGQPVVATDGAGNAYVLWTRFAGDTPVWFARYQTGSGWQPAVALGAPRLGETAFGPRLAVSASGQVMALWNSLVFTEAPPIRTDVWWSTLAAPEANWSTPALLENDNAGDAEQPEVVADSAGNFHAVWSQFASSSKSRLLHRQYTLGAGWSTTVAISSADGASDINGAAKLIADGNGNLMVTWGLRTSGAGGPRDGTFARRYEAGGGWQPEVRIGASPAAPAFGNSLAVAPDGSIAAVWTGTQSTFDTGGPIWISVFR